MYAQSRQEVDDLNHMIMGGVPLSKRSKDYQLHEIRLQNAELRLEKQKYKNKVNKQQKKIDKLSKQIENDYAKRDKLSYEVEKLQEICLRQ